MSSSVAGEPGNYRPLPHCFPSWLGINAGILLSLAVMLLCSACNSSALDPDAAVPPDGFVSRDATTTVDIAGPKECTARLTCSFGYILESTCEVWAGGNSDAKVFQIDDQFDVPKDTYNWFIAYFNDPNLGPGTFKYQDLPVQYGSFIDAQVPGANYTLNRDAQKTGDMTLVLWSFIKTPMYAGLAPDGHGTLDAVLPYDNGRQDMGVPGSTCALHVIF